LSNYTKSTNFATKDNLTPGDPLKIVRGTEIDTEFNNIATAIATKTDNASAALTGGTINDTTIGATTASTGAFTTLAASGNVTLSGGTANGVAYLNGSKVVTSGSALVFDGSNLGVGTSSPAAKLDVSSSGEISRFRTSTARGSGNGYFGFYDPTGRKGYYGYGGGDDSLYIANEMNAPILFITNSVERLRLDASGNLGLGVTPSAWGGGYRALDVQFGAIANTNAGSVDVAVTQNAFFNGSNWITKYSGQSKRQVLSDAGFVWHLGASQTAGDAISFTQAMTLDASGNLGIGTTSPTARLESFRSDGGLIMRLSRSSTDRLDFYAGSGVSYIDSSPAGGQLAFATVGTERARIDSSGNLLVGTTTTGSYFDGKVTSFSANTYPVFAGKQGESAASVMIQWNAGTTGDNIFTYFVTETSPTVRGSISYNRAGGLTAYNVTSDYRAKDIYGPVTNSGALIDSVPVYMGKMKDATQERPMFIAHETPEYAHTGVKDAVDADGNPVYQQMDASALIPVMWAEIQSLRKRLADAGIA
jgi:hypothetical protein